LKLKNDSENTPTVTRLVGRPRSTLYARGSLRRSFCHPKASLRGWAPERVEMEIYTDGGGRKREGGGRERGGELTVMEISYFRPCG